MDTKTLKNYLKWTDIVPQYSEIGTDICWHLYPTSFPPSLKVFSYHPTTLSEHQPHPGYRYLPESFGDGKKVQLNIQNIKGGKLRELPKGCETVQFSDCKIGMPTKFHDDLKKLVILDCEVFNIPNILPQGLTELTLYGLSIIDLPTLPDSLQILSISGHSLGKLPSSLPSSLIELYAADCELTKLPSSFPDNLRIAQLSGNKLTKFDIALPKTLEELHLNNNHIEHINCEWPEGIKKINVAFNTDKTTGKPLTIKFKHNPPKDCEVVYW